MTDLKKSSASKEKQSNAGKAPNKLSFKGLMLALVTGLVLGSVATVALDGHYRLTASKTQKQPVDSSVTEGSNEDKNTIKEDAIVIELSDRYHRASAAYKLIRKLNNEDIEYTAVKELIPFFNGNQLQIVEDAYNFINPDYNEFERYVVGKIDEHKRPVFFSIKKVDDAQLDSLDQLKLLKNCVNNKDDKEIGKVLASIDKGDQVIADFEQKIVFKLALIKGLEGILSENLQ